MTQIRGLLALLLPMVLAACGAGPAPSADGHDDTLVLGTLGDIGNWNPYLDDSAFGRDVLAQVYPSLIQEQPDYRDHPPSFEPALAESWSFSPDRRTLVFTLRPDARWSDGVPITARDVVFTWRCQAAPEVGWTESWVKEHITDVRALDERRVQFTFDRVYPYQLMDANEGLIIPEHAWGEIELAAWETTDWSALALGGGPFVPAHHRPHEEIALDRNPAYWRQGHPRVDRVVWRVVPSQAGLVTQLLAGELHFVPSVGADDVPRIGSHPDTRLLVYPGRSYTYVGWNTRRPLLAEPDVRRALTLAIDRQSILDTVERGHGVVAVGPVLSSMWAFNEELTPLPHDPERASQLLAAAGWRDGDGDGVLDRDGEPFAFELLTNVETQARQDVCLLIQEQLGRVGIRVEPRFVEAGSMLARMYEGDFDAYVGGWLEPTKIDLWDLWHSAPADAPLSNFIGYSNPEVDRLLEEADEAADFAAQKPLLDRIQELIVADQPYTFLYEQRGRAAISDRVHGADVNDASPYFNLEEWEVR